MGDYAPHAADESRTATACEVTMLWFSHPQRAVRGDRVLQLVEISANINRPYQCMISGLTVNYPCQNKV